MLSKNSNRLECGQNVINQDVVIEIFLFNKLFKNNDIQNNLLCSRLFLLFELFPEFCIILRSVSYTERKSTF